jgi:hypothetical protein
MGVNSTEVAYNFGQMGSIYVDGTAAITSNEVTSAAIAGAVGTKAVFVAVTFVTDTVFDGGTTGLVAETSTLYPDSTGTGTAIENTGGSVVDGITFPAGLTVYGRWTGFKLASGSVIAYIGY